MSFEIKCDWSSTKIKTVYSILLQFSLEMMWSFAALIRHVCKMYITALQRLVVGWFREMEGSCDSDIKGTWNWIILVQQNVIKHSKHFFDLFTLNPKTHYKYGTKYPPEVCCTLDRDTDHKISICFPPFFLYSNYIFYVFWRTFLILQKCSFKVGSS